jgi:hypothetical protein
MGQKKYTYATPQTKEAYYYRKIFESLYPGEYCEKCTNVWKVWSKFVTDPSGRFQRKYIENKEEGVKEEELEQNEEKKE